ncbi:hypothetical protein BBK36DRAFT_1144160 [Trichoderma citrinoviride]|uniref:Cytochrome b561 domain-containing protein n=1 Tax=Trichoderma citrinoviride TaxID=58853 RepID=A0A2T4B1A3_9HYPO|nr:hypothetical protein BBK36DRAFT_1144160 [Trichoderma citrinoviride]PTB63099.1 hypothetical protein BBK36DRAFT_1144160 [Trichoderma citrinoviride]
MMRNYRVALSVLLLTLASNLVLAQEVKDQVESRDVHTIEPRDSFKVWNRERNAHACIMSIVFIVLYPLGAISVHLPIDQIPYLRNTYLQNKIMAMHVPIQILAFVMMVGGMALGIRVAQFLGFIHDPVRAHVVIGLLTVCTIILFQPALGVLQHRHFKRTGGKSKFAYIHRWIGRGAIILGMINTGLGFQLAKKNVIIHNKTYVREYVLLGILVTAWVFFVLYDEFRLRRRVVPDGGEKGAAQQQEAKR